MRIRTAVESCVKTPGKSHPLPVRGLFICCLQRTRAAASRNQTDREWVALSTLRRSVLSIVRGQWQDRNSVGVTCSPTAPRARRGDRSLLRSDGITAYRGAIDRSLLRSGSADLEKRRPEPLSRGARGKKSAAADSFRLDLNDLPLSWLRFLTFRSLVRGGADVTVALMKLSNPAQIKPAISLEVLEAIDVRVGTIERVEEVKGSDRLVKLKVDFGDHKRTILAGMKQERAQPKEIEGRQALFVVNLEPRKIMGEVSEGMLFDIGYADGLIPVLAVPEKEVPNGTRAG